MEPWPTLSTPHQITDKVQSGQRLQIPIDCPLKDIITASWEGDPSRRPSFKGFILCLLLLRLIFIVTLFFRKSF
jgi:hypothetical protein